MLTAPALRSQPDEYDSLVTRIATLVAGGWTDKAIRSQLRARRWQRAGRAIVLHNRPLSRREAEWQRRDGRRVVAEVDGAIHLVVSRWVSDQLRQNELVIGGDIVLRCPSVVVRTDEAYVADQLRRALDLG